MSNATYIAIDPGSNGGIAIWKKNRLEQVVKMPKDLSDLKKYFEHLKENNSEIIAFIEKVQIFPSDNDEENKASISFGCGKSLPSAPNFRFGFPKS